MNLIHKVLCERDVLRTLVRVVRAQGIEGVSQRARLHRQLGRCNLGEALGVRFFHRRSLAKDLEEIITGSLGRFAPLPDKVHGEEQFRRERDAAAGGGINKTDIIRAHTTFEISNGRPRWHSFDKALQRLERLSRN